MGAQRRASGLVLVVERHRLVVGPQHVHHTLKVPSSGVDERAREAVGGVAGEVVRRGIAPIEPRLRRLQVSRRAGAACQRGAQGLPGRLLSRDVQRAFEQAPGSQRIALVLEVLGEPQREPMQEAFGVRVRRGRQVVPGPLPMPERCAHLPRQELRAGEAVRDLRRRCRRVAILLAKRVEPRGLRHRGCSRDGPRPVHRLLLRAAVSAALPTAGGAQRQRCAAHRARDDPSFERERGVHWSAHSIASGLGGAKRSSA